MTGFLKVNRELAYPVGLPKSVEHAPIRRFLIQEVLGRFRRVVERLQLLQTSRYVNDMDNCLIIVNDFISRDLTWIYRKNAKSPLPLVQILLLAVWCKVKMLSYLNFVP